MKNLKNTIVVITGASSGIGRACVPLFVEQGARVALISRRREALDEVAAEYPEACLAVAADVTDETSVAAAFSEIEKKWGSPDILINNAGVGFATDLSTCSLEDYRQILDTNLTGVFLCTRAVLPGMKTRSSGHIINVSSVVGKVSNPNAPLYCASKHALNGYTSGLQQQVAKAGIRVSSVSPAAVDTAYWDGRDVNRALFLKASEVAEVILFVATRPEGVLIKDVDLCAQR